MIALLIALVAQVDEPFSRAANVYSGCLVECVKMGMTMRIDPKIFEEGLAKSCLWEEAVFRTEAIRVAKAAGRTQEQAEAEIAGNIANGRRIFAADQANFMATGRVPR